MLNIVDFPTTDEFVRDMIGQLQKVHLSGSAFDLVLNTPSLKSYSIDCPLIDINVQCMIPAVRNEAAGGGGDDKYDDNNNNNWLQIAVMLESDKQQAKCDLERFDSLCRASPHLTHHSFCDPMIRLTLHCVELLPRFPWVLLLLVASYVPGSDLAQFVPLVFHNPSWKSRSSLSLDPKFLLKGMEHMDLLIASIHSPGTCH